ncbi:hypothetical protein [Paracoccus sp. pheM1]|uniref:hypothetical protein n=1 Tax=Paracoccus sp. pheM1 TaxID=2831675 RepID=UPI001BDB9166|nr:hypothetical protein [Paracoccus sp. pheM1]MBT0782822.1 hypothetical protein [Paracoccus sp. pheM1]
MKLTAVISGGGCSALAIVAYLQDQEITSAAEGKIVLNAITLVADGQGNIEATGGLS